MNCRLVHWPIDHKLIKTAHPIRVCDRIWHGMGHPPASLIGVTVAVARACSGAERNPEQLPVPSFPFSITRPWAFALALEDVHYLGSYAGYSSLFTSTLPLPPSLRSFSIPMQSINAHEVLRRNQYHSYHDNYALEGLNMVLQRLPSRADPPISLVSRLPPP